MKNYKVMGILTRKKTNTPKCILKCILKEVTVTVKKGHTVASAIDELINVWLGAGFHVIAAWVPGLWQGSYINTFPKITTLVIEGEKVKLRNFLRNKGFQDKPVDGLYHWDDCLSQSEEKELWREVENNYIPLGLSRRNMEASCGYIRKKIPTLA